MHEDWTVPGPCPKRRSESWLEDADGRVVLAGARSLFGSPDGRWTVWTGGASGFENFAHDHRANVLLPIPWTDRVLANAWCPTADRLVLVRSQGARHRLVLVDLTTNPPAARDLGATRDWVDSIAWSPEGARLAILQEKESETDPRVLLSVVRSIEAPVIESVVEARGRSGSFAVAWEDAGPRLTTPR